MSQKTLNLCLERYNFVKFGETTKSTHTVLCTNNAHSVNSDKYRLTPTAIASKHGEGYVFTLNYDFDRPLFTIVQKSYSIDGTSGKIVFEGIDPISKDGSKYLRRVEVSPVKLSDGSYLLEVTKDEYLRIGTTGAALGDEDLESLNEKIVTMGGIEKSVETVGGKQVLKLDGSGPSGKEIVYFDVDPSDPPSGIYASITEALSNNKLTAVKIDGAVYLYTATGTDKYVFVGGFTKESVGYTEIEVSDDDSVTSKSVDDKVFNMYMLYRTDPASPGDPPGTEDYWICDENKHVITKAELIAAHADCRYFILNNDIEPGSNSRKYFASVTVISNSYIRLQFYMMEQSDVSVANFFQKTVSEDSEGRLYISSSYSAYLASASDVAALQSQVASLSDVSAYSVKGEATVAQLNAGPSGIQAGWAYQLTDSGTLTAGSLAVVAGDTVAWDGTKWFPLVKSDYYATKTYAQNVAHSIAPEFNPTRTSENPYKAGEVVTYTDGKSYVFKVDHYGPWSAADVERTDIADAVGVSDLSIADSNCTLYSSYDETKIGYYANTDGYHETLIYDTFVVEAKHNGSIYAQNYNVEYFSIVVFDDSSQNSGVRYRKVEGGENTLPTEENPASFVKGNYIAITTKKNVGFLCVLQDYVFLKTLKDDVFFSQSQIDQIVAMQKSKVVCRFVNSSGDGSSTQRFEIFVPAKVGYVKYQFVHSVSIGKNSDCWRIQSAVAVDDNFAYRFDLTKNGEWECAIRLVGRDDFSGGITHGNEVLVDASFWADGEKLDLQTLPNTPFLCSKFRIATSSHLYDNADGTTNFADHGCEHIFSKDGCEIAQSVKFVEASDIYSAYLAMGLPSANVTDHYIVDSDINGGVEAPAYQKIITSDLQKFFVYGDSSGVAFTMELLNNYPFLQNPYRGLLVHSGYNKTYFVIRYNESYSVAANTLWLSRHRVNFEVGK